MPLPAAPVTNATLFLHIMSYLPYLCYVPFVCTATISTLRGFVLPGLDGEGRINHRMQIALANVQAKQLRIAFRLHPMED